LERLAAGEVVTGRDIAQMGVGGLLKEITQRPQPRSGPVSRSASAANIAAVILAGGRSMRMRGRDKLLEVVDDVPVLHHIVQAAVNSKVQRTLVVIPPGNSERRSAASTGGAEVIEARETAEGMAGSIRAALACVSGKTDAVMLVLGDMPEIGTNDIDRLISAYDPDQGHEICRATSSTGRPGHPVLFGKRFFEALSGLHGDEGARSVLRASPDCVVDVPLNGDAAVIDLDTPEEWLAWRARR